MQKNGGNKMKIVRDSQELVDKLQSQFIIELERRQNKAERTRKDVC